MGHEGGALMSRISALIKESLESSLTLHPGRWPSTKRALTGLQRCWHPSSDF